MTNSSATNAEKIRAQMPPGGLFAGHEWRISPTPFALGEKMAADLESLGRVLLQFYKAVNLLYRQSHSGKRPAWIAQWLDAGKPESLIELQRHPAFKNEVPRVIRPDLLLTQEGFAITELDSVPGGIGLTAWLNQAYAGLKEGQPGALIGDARSMLDGFAGIFGDACSVHIMVSEEAATYRPEMEWLAKQLGERFLVQDGRFTEIAEGDAVYRFFELFDLKNVPGAARILEAGLEKKIRFTPPPKPIFEEKMLFALLWNRNLRDFWRAELGEGFLQRLQRAVPYTWLVDPIELSPNAAIPRLELTDWNQLKTMSQKERDLILKVSGFSEEAWGARGVYLGSDLSQADWSAAVDRALQNASTTPYVLQQYHKPHTVPSGYFDFAAQKMISMPGRVRLCPYYFVQGDDDQARTKLGGVLATICPADKKIIHGMRDAILAPCSV